MQENNQRLGIIYTFSAYLFWGFITIYWKQIDHVPAGQILAHRIIWSCIFMLLLVTATGKMADFLQLIRSFLRNKQQLIGITAASIVISANWFIFIWAVVSGHVLQASLGYYINPLISILLGIIFLKEAVTTRQIVSFGLAAAAVTYLTASYGVFPWVSLILAFSFALYGLLKKTVHITAMFGLTIETIIVTPIALIYLLAIPDNLFTFSPIMSSLNLYFVGAGIATAIPLLLFSSGAKMIPLGMVGFLQYITPTIMFVLGVFVYDEPFTSAHLVTFILIWSALAIYMSSMYKRPKRKGIKHP